MPDISKITLPSGTTYDIKDTVARATAAGGLQFRGITTTALTDKATTTTYSIDGESHTAANGDLVIYGSKEFVFSTTDNKWHELGDNTSLKALAYKDSATGSYKPEGTVSQPTFTGSSSNVTITSTTNTSGNYQPTGTVSQPTFTGNNFTPSGSVSFTNENKTTTVSTATINTSNPKTYTPSGSISVTTAGATTTVNSITAVGTLPSLTTTVDNETLTIGWSAGTLPTKGSNTTVKTGDAAYGFTGTDVRLVTGNISVPKSASFSGTAAQVSGTVSQPTFTGTKVQLAGTTTAAGTVSQPTFTGTSKNVTVS